MTVISNPLLGIINHQQQAKKTLIFLPCLVQKTTPITCLILDKKGLGVAELNSIQKVGQPSIIFQLPKLKAGAYNCWIEIGTIVGVGTTNELQQYRFLDKKPENGINYYRLRQVDFDGSEEIHKTISVVIDKGNGSISIYPNPASDNVQLTLNDAIQARIIIKLYDTNGRVVYQGTIEPNRGYSEIDVSSGVRTK